MNSGKFIIFNTIAHGPHDIGRGVPADIWLHDTPLTNRQQALLDRLPEYDSRVTVRKSDVSMTDLAALTAKTNVEFAMFTRGAKRLMIRGDAGHVNVSPFYATFLHTQGYRWSGHTHIEDNLVASAGDKNVLRQFSQNWGVIYNAKGDFNTFNKLE